MSYFHYDDAVREFARARKCIGYKKLGNNVYLYSRGEYFAVQLRGTDVVHIYPDYQQLYCGGWRSMTTFRAINTWSCLRPWGLGPYSKCGFEETLRINGLPFFDGIRIDNCGQVFPEDRRSDWKKVVRPEVTAAWKKLHTPITKGLQGRFDLGEFDNIEYDQGNAITQSEFLLEEFLMLDPAFPEPDRMVELLRSTPTRVAARGWNNWHHLDARSRWKWLLNVLRHEYYLANDAYMRVEVSNAVPAHLTCAGMSGILVDGRNV